MSMTDPLADMFTRIRNGSVARFDKVDLPLSKVKLELARLLREEGFIKNYKMYSEGNKQVLRIYLKYDARNRGVISGLKRVSKPGRRIYVKSTEIPSVLDGYGVNIISTPKGILTDREARKLNLGGEVVCSVW